jgi:TRAP-type C4-dicarboxylate transport system substrate-binding protein
MSEIDLHCAVDAKSATLVPLAVRPVTANEPEHRAAIREAAAEIRLIWRTTVAQKTEEGRAFCAQKGMQIDDTNFAAFRAAMAPAYDGLRDKIGADLVSQVMKAAQT